METNRSWFLDNYAIKRTAGFVMIILSNSTLRIEFTYGVVCETIIQLLDESKWLKRTSEWVHKWFDPHEWKVLRILLINEIVTNINDSFVLIGLINTG